MFLEGPRNASEKHSFPLKAAKSCKCSGTLSSISTNRTGNSCAPVERMKKVVLSWAANCARLMRLTEFDDAALLEACERPALLVFATEASAFILSGVPDAMAATAPACKNLRRESDMVLFLLNCRKSFES